VCVCFKSPLQRFNCCSKRAFRSVLFTDRIRKKDSTSASLSQSQRALFLLQTGEMELNYSDKHGGTEAPKLDEIELVYIAFDILYKGSQQSLIKKPLRVCVCVFACLCVCVCLCVSVCVCVLV